MIFKSELGIYACRNIITFTETAMSIVILSEMTEKLEISIEEASEY